MTSTSELSGYTDDQLVDHAISLAIGYGTGRDDILAEMNAARYELKARLASERAAALSNRKAKDNDA